MTEDQSHGQEDVAHYGCDQALKMGGLDLKRRWNICSPAKMNRVVTGKKHLMLRNRSASYIFFKPETNNGEVSNVVRAKC